MYTPLSISTVPRFHFSSKYGEGGVDLISELEWAQNSWAWGFHGPTSRLQEQAHEQTQTKIPRLRSSFCAQTYVKLPRLWENQDKGATMEGFPHFLRWPNPLVNLYRGELKLFHSGKQCETETHLSISCYGFHSTLITQRATPTQVWSTTPSLSWKDAESKLLFSPHMKLPWESASLGSLAYFKPYCTDFGGN